MQEKFKCQTDKLRHVRAAEFDHGQGAVNFLECFSGFNSSDFAYPAAAACTVVTRKALVMIRQVFFIRCEPTHWAYLFIDFDHEFHMRIMRGVIHMVHFFIRNNSLAWDVGLKFPGVYFFGEFLAKT